MGFGRFWVNGTELQENNTLYAHVGDTLNVLIETGTSLSGDITVSFQQVGGSLSFSGGSLVDLGNNVNQGVLSIPVDIQNTELGLYRASLLAGKGFNFHVNISHAPPIITNITLWDATFKPEKESVLEGGTYENYRSATIYANITYKIRSTYLYTQTPAIVMRYHNGTGTQMDVPVTTSTWPGSGTFTCMSPAIVTTPDTNNQWRPGSYPLNFTITYAGVLDGFAGISLHILDIPPNITSFSLTPDSLALPTTDPMNASIRFAVTDPDDDLLYGTADTSIKMVREGNFLSEEATVSHVQNGTTLAFNFTDTVARSAEFYVSLDTTNVTNVDATSFMVGMKMQKNQSTVTGARVQAYDGPSDTWVEIINVAADTAGVWYYHTSGVLAPANYMIVNGSREMHVRVQAWYSSDVEVKIDWLNVTYNTTLRPGVTGVIVTTYYPYARGDSSTNKSITKDVTECYDDSTNQWMFNLSFTPGLEKGPYTIRVDVYDHGTAPYQSFSIAIDRYNSTNYRTIYSAGRATLSRGIMVGAINNNNLTKIQRAVRWGGSATGMTVNRGDSVNLAVDINDNAFQDTLDEPGTNFPFNANLTVIELPARVINGSLNYTETINQGYCNISLGNPNNPTHSVGLNNLPLKFTLDKYYFVPNEDITTITLDIRACISTQGMPTNTIDFGALQVFNATYGTWHNLTIVPQDTKFVRFYSYTDMLTRVLNYAEFSQCIQPQTREIWFRLAYNESSKAVADGYGLNVTIDYARLTVSSYTHHKSVIAMLTQDLGTFYWFPMMTGIAGAQTTWSVTIPTSSIPIGTYDLVIRTQTLFNGVNYNFTGRFTNTGPYHITQDWQGLLFKNSTLKVKTAGISIAINPAWVNKTVLRGKPAALNLQGTYSITYGTLSAGKLRLELKQGQGGDTTIYNLEELGADTVAFAYTLGTNGNWWGNISFTRSYKWPAGVHYFRLWVEANDGAANATEWNEMYLDAAPPFAYLQPTFPAELELWRETPTLADYNPMNVTDYDTVNFHQNGNSKIVLEAENRTGGLHVENFTIWTKSGGSQVGVEPTYLLTGIRNVPKDVANKTYNNFTLVATDSDLIMPQVSVVRLSATFHINNNFPQVKGVTYNTTTPFRYIDTNVTVEYEDIDETGWENVSANLIVKNSGGSTVLQVNNPTFLWTGIGNTRNATFRFLRDTLPGALTANLTLVDPDNGLNFSLTTLTLRNNLPVVTSLDMTHNGYTFPLQHASLFPVNRSTDTLGFAVTLRDEEDSYLLDKQVAQVRVRLKHEDTVDAANNYVAKYIDLSCSASGDVNGVQTWVNPSFTLDRADVNFGTGTVNVTVEAFDKDGEKNLAYEAGGAMMYPDFIVNNSMPYFISSEPVAVAATMDYYGLWNVTIRCSDWEGIGSIIISYKGYKEGDNDHVTANDVGVTANGEVNKWAYYDLINAYVCSINLTETIGQFNLKYLNVTAVKLCDSDYNVVFLDEVYGRAWVSMEFNNLRTVIGVKPTEPPNWTTWILIIVAIVGGICAVYAFFYFRKRTGYRKYM